MATIINTKGPVEWLNEIKRRFKIHNTRINETETSITAFLKTTGPYMNVMIGRYCKLTGKGSIRDRRNKVRGEDE